MADKTALGDRMKCYEAATRAVLPRRTHTVIRVDVRAAHTYLRAAVRPYDQDFMNAMNAVAEALCQDMQGAVFAYTQSDECSVLLADYGSAQSEPWFGGGVQKMASVAASTATGALIVAHGGGPAGMTPSFDARVFTIPDPVEVANYFLWRQRDCVRNSITMAAQAKFSHKQLHGKAGGDMQDMLWREHGINWNDYPDGAKRGRVCVRHTADEEVAYTDRRTKQPVTTTAVRSRWLSEAAPHFSADPSGWLAATIPALPTLAAASREP